MTKKTIETQCEQASRDTPILSTHNSPPRHDLDRVKLVEADFGQENLIRTESVVWHFDAEIGVWIPLDTQELEARTIRVLELHGEAVNTSRVSSTVRMFVSHNFKKKFEFDRGDPNIIVNQDGYWHFADGKWVVRDAQRDLYRRTALPFRRIEQEPLAFEAFQDSVFATEDGAPLSDAVRRQIIWDS